MMDRATSVTTLCSSSPEPPVEFALAEIERVLAAAGRSARRLPLGELASAGGGWRVILASTPEASRGVAESLGVLSPQDLGREGYAIRRVGEATVVVLADDPVGAMYGGLEVAEVIRLGRLDSLNDVVRRPYVERRGIKFNIPLDARTPSYSDAADSAQQNIAEVWQMDFWRTYLDEMARHRYNVLALWSLHPFPSMVKVPEFPDVALDDVMRTRAGFDDSYSLCGHDMVRPETLADLERVVTISIDQKIAFWRAVMQLALDRGIETYIFTWNIFTFGADGKYGITHEQDNPRTLAYFRASVREMVLTYPLLAGIGITAGERMSAREDEYDKEPWLWRAYGEGVRDALRQQPGRDVRMIHRYHQTALSPIVDAWRDYPGTFELSYKYAMAHMYAHTVPAFADEALRELPDGMRMWMTLRNDDIYSFRWGDPDYARAFIRALPARDKMAGYYMGPDGYTWGREFISTDPESPRELVIQKQWYSFMLWGRLSYDPTIGNDHFQQVIAARFPRTDALSLYRAWQEASCIIPLVTRFHWEHFDFQWYPEACLSRRSFKGFHTIRHFVEGKPMPGAGLADIRRYAEATLAGEAVDAIPPPEVVRMLRSHAEAAREAAARVQPGENKELRLTLGDIQAMSTLGDYYAAKIEAAVSLVFYEVRGREADRDAAVASLQQAAAHWRAYAAAAGRQYKPQLLTRVGMADLDALTSEVDQDIEVAQQWKHVAGC